MRLNNRSQLAGFAKQDDLKFFAHTLCDIDYAHMPDLAPTREMFERYKLQKGDWEIYSSDFIDLITKDISNRSKRVSLLMLAYCVANINHIIATDGWLLSARQINGLMSLSCIYSGWVVSVRPNTRTQLPQTMTVPDDIRTKEEDLAC